MVHRSTNMSGVATGTNGKVSVSYRGVENPWGNILSHVNGINIWGDGKMGGGEPYYCNNLDFTESKITGNYAGAGYTLANANGYISAFGYSPVCDWMFLPSETLGNSALPVGDYLYVTTDLHGYRTSLLSGCWYSGSFAGSFYWYLYSGVATRSRDIGARLTYTPKEG